MEPFLVQTGLAHGREHGCGWLRGAGTAAGAAGWSQTAAARPPCCSPGPPAALLLALLRLQQKRDVLKVLFIYLEGGGPSATTGGSEAAAAATHAWRRAHRGGSMIGVVSALADGKLVVVGSKEPHSRRESCELSTGCTWRASVQLASMVQYRSGNEGVQAPGMSSFRALSWRPRCQRACFLR